MYPFVFNPFGRNNTVNILDLVIPKVKTIALGESTENVVLGICPKPQKNHKLLTWLDSLLMIVELRKRA